MQRLHVASLSLRDMVVSPHVWQAGVMETGARETWLACSFGAEDDYFPLGWQNNACGVVEQAGASGVPVCFLQVGHPIQLIPYQGDYVLRENQGSIGAGVFLSTPMELSQDCPYQRGVEGGIDPHVLSCEVIAGAVVGGGPVSASRHWLPISACGVTAAINIVYMGPQPLASS